MNKPTENWEDNFKRRLELFMHKGDDGDDPPDHWAWTVKGSFPIIIEEFVIKFIRETITSELQGLGERIIQKLSDNENISDHTLADVRRLIRSLTSPDTSN